MAWTKYIKCPVNSRGEVDTSNLPRTLDTSGVYAIATYTSGFWSNSYHIHYVGRTKRSMRDRLKNHLRQHSNGSKQIKALLAQKQAISSNPLSALYVTCFPTKEHKIIERARIQSMDPLLNLQGGRDLPPGLTHQHILQSKLD
ncbi:MAG: hypothetical protein VKJ64_21565 [Leptolyngbyaceae bacterium]|nr:hypothetical protein [Leptolyngbyaceae bacterium]